MVLGTVLRHFLTNLSRLNFPISMGRTSLIQILGVLGGIFHFYSNSYRSFCKQTVETLIRRRILRRLVWVCAFCLYLCPTKRIRTYQVLGRCLLFGQGSSIVCIFGACYVWRECADTQAHMSLGCSLIR